MSYSVTFVNAMPGGFNPRQFALNLTWTDSTDSNAVSVNVYRGLVSGGPYTKISNVLNGVQAFSDTTVAPATTYFYVLTEVNNSSQESGFSTEQSATVGGP